MISDHIEWLNRERMNLSLKPNCFSAQPACLSLGCGVLLEKFQQITLINPFISNASTFLNKVRQYPTNFIVKWHIRKNPRNDIRVHFYSECSLFHNLWFCGLYTHLPFHIGFDVLSSSFPLFQNDYILDSWILFPSTALFFITQWECFAAFVPRWGQWL